MYRHLGREFVKIILAILVVEFIYWSTQDYIIYNDSFINKLPILYYSSAPILAVLLLIILVLIRHLGETIIIYLCILLLETYFLFSISQLYGAYCVEFKNLSELYFTINLLIMISIAILFYKYIAVYLSFQSILVISIASLVLILDYYFFLVGYSFFYLARI